MHKHVARLRLGQMGDTRRPVGWKKIAKKIKVSLEKIKEIRRSEEYYAYVLEICRSIGIARLQAKAARRSKSLSEHLENVFGLDIYSARTLALELDTNSLPIAPDNSSITEERIEELAQAADGLIINIAGKVDTITLSRKHVRWLLEQGYADSDMLLLRASTMTRSVYSRTKPDFMTA